jgi:YD repeat-containing protein
VFQVIALLLGLLLGTARADFCFPTTCTPTATATVTTAGSATFTRTATATATNTPTTAPTKFSVSGQVTAYAGEAAAGHGVGAVVASAQDVASAGGGVQDTTIVSFTVATGGLYEVVGSVSVTTTDTVTVAVTYTDAVNLTSQTVNIVDAILIAANATRPFSYTARAKAPPGSTVTAKYTLSTQTSTKASGTIRRLQ